MQDKLNDLLNMGIDFGIKLLMALLLIIIGFRLIKFLTGKLKKGKLFQKIEKSNQTFFISLIAISLKILLLIIAVSMIGIPMTSIITIIGSAGLALGLALQGGLSNIAGGMLIMVFKPFKVGDFIETNSISGTVKEINIFNTALLTPDNKKVVIPNGGLSNTTVINYNVNPERRLDLEFTVSYDSDLKKVKNVLFDVAKKSKYVIQDKDKVIALSDHASDSLVYVFKVWVKSADYFNAKFEIMENVKLQFDENKIEIPYKQMDVHIIK